MHVRHAALFQPGERGEARGHEDARTDIRRAGGERVGARLDPRPVGVVRRGDQRRGERDAAAIEGHRQERRGRQHDPRPERLQPVERRRDGRRAVRERRRAGEERQREGEREQGSEEPHRARWSARRRTAVKSTGHAGYALGIAHRSYGPAADPRLQFAGAQPPSEVSMARRRKTPGFATTDYEYPQAPDYVIAELRYDSRVAVSGRGRLGAPAGAEPAVRTLHETLGAFDVKRVAPHFDLPERALAARATGLRARARPTADYAQSGFVQIVPRNPKDAPRIAARLARAKPVWQAYVAPRPVPAAAPAGASATSRNFEPAQGYLHSAPNGIGAMEVWPIAGGKGRGVRVCDIEGNWQYRHQDLPRGIPLLGGTVIADLGWRNHGTAVLGEIVSKPGISGTVGIAHQARAATHSAIVG